MPTSTIDLIVKVLQFTAFTDAVSLILVCIGRPRPGSIPLSPTARSRIWYVSFHRDQKYCFLFKVKVQFLQSPMCFASAVVVSLGEGIYTRSQLKANAKGRPSLIVLISTSLALAGVSLQLFLLETKVGIDICKHSAFLMCFALCPWSLTGKHAAFLDSCRYLYLPCLLLHNLFAQMRRQVMWAGLHAGTGTADPGTAEDRACCGHSCFSHPPNLRHQAGF